mmetsp:Transcript_34116/g.62426  ORF Transcript_34116/g.62426 Transcript_34116/m.62426 type:complete len:383 (-) Transcript_34116:251-1399(-)
MNPAMPGMGLHAAGMNPMFDTFGYGMDLGPSGGSKGSKAPRRPKDDDDETFTTIMLRNIPNKYTRKMLIDQLHLAGFKGDIDYLYLPTDFQNRCNVGYCFCNLRTPEARARLQQQFDGVAAQTCLPGFNSYKICQVTKAKWQGREENVRRLKSGPELMAQLALHPEWLPLLLDSEGNQENFQIDDIDLSGVPNTGMDAVPKSVPMGGKGAGRRQGGKRGKGTSPMDQLAWMYAQQAAGMEAGGLGVQGRGGNGGGKRRGGKGGRGKGQNAGFPDGAYPGMPMVSVMGEGMQYMPYDPYDGASYFMGPYAMEQQLYGFPSYANPYGAYPFGWGGGGGAPGAGGSDPAGRAGKSGGKSMDEALLEAMMEDAPHDEEDEEEPSDL